MSRESILFGHKTIDGFRHIEPNRRYVKMCGSNHPIVKVMVRANDGGDYWAWWDNNDSCFMFVYRRKVLVEMCFPYGTKAEESRGRGELMCVEVSTQDT